MMLITGLLTWGVLLLDCLSYGDIITAGTKKSDVKISNASEHDPDKQSLDTVYMIEHCSGLVNAYRQEQNRVYVDTSMIIQAAADTSVGTKTNCKVTFSARDPSERLILHFEEMNINYRTMTEDKLQIYDGYDTHKPLTRSHGLYGRYSKLKRQQSIGTIVDYISTGQVLTLWFVGELSKEFTGFTVLLTVFRDANEYGYCPPLYMKCVYSKRCIPQILRCNGYQNCGQDDLSDISDCNNTPPPGSSSNSKFVYNTDFGLMVGCAISIVILLVVVLWLGIVCIKRTKRYRAARRYHNPSVHIPAPHSDVDGAIVEPAAIHHVMAPPISFLEPPPPYSAQPTAVVPRHDRQLELPPPYSVDERDTAGLLINESPDGHCPPERIPGRMVQSASTTSTSSTNPGLVPPVLIVASPSQPRLNGVMNGSNSAGDISNTNCESRKEHDDIESAREAVDISHESTPLERVPSVECQPQITVTSHTPSGNFFHLTGMPPGQEL